MFTGIVQELGAVTGLHPEGEIVKLRIKSTAASGGEDRIGDSICINGVCLTLVSFPADHILEFDLSLETAKTTTLGGLRISDRVNLERALRLSDRLGGHLLSGHIDGLGYIRTVSKSGRHYLLGVEVPRAVSDYVVEKGSIGLDGVSLTISSLERGLVWVSIIPHTASVTTLKEKKPGDRVNLEADLLAKYIHRLLSSHPFCQSGGLRTDSSPSTRTVSREFLAKHGFLS